MIILPTENKVLEETVVSKLKAEKLDVCKIEINDFDETSYKVVIKPDDPTAVFVSMNLGCWSDVKDMGGELAVSDEFQKYLVEGEDNINLRFDTASLAEGEADAIGVKISKLRATAIGGPFRAYFKNLNTDCGAPPAFPMKLRPDTTLYFVPKDDRLVVVYQLDFTEPTDRVIARVFLHEFQEAKRNRAVAAAPIVSFSPEAPAEIAQFGVEGAHGVGFVSFVVLKSHVDSDEKSEKAMHLLTNFRNYIQYHIKCSKSFFHARMRDRVKNLLQILNRAKNTPASDKKKKTASGKTFAR